MVIQDSKLQITAIDDAGDWLNDNDTNHNSPFEIVSITRTTTGGCDRLRVKARFSNTYLYLYNCVINVNIAQAEFVMDFQFNH